MSKNKKLALSGIMAALSVTFLLATGLIPIGTFALPALSGLLTTIIVIESGKSYAWSMFVAVSVLGAVLAPDKEAALYYIAFFGYYPIIKNIIESLQSRILQFIIKLAAFNAAVISCFFISINLLSIPKESFSIGGYYLPWLFLALGNIVFAVYDYALSSLIISYILRWRKKFFKK